MTERYFKCLECGQVVQGINASQDIRCCEEKNMHELMSNPPDADECWGESIMSDTKFAREHGLR